MSDYSGTPLSRKLGFKPEHTVWVANAPIDFAALLEPLTAGVTVLDDSPRADIAIVFATDRHDIEEGFTSAIGKIPPDGAIWVAWPKRSSGITTELTEDVMRELFLPTGLVDIKVCAIDDTWSGLKFVVRKENRAEWNR